jgi:hypothetical protein
MGHAFRAQTLCLILDLTLRAHNLLEALRGFHGSANPALTCSLGYIYYMIGVDNISNLIFNVICVFIVGDDGMSTCRLEYWHIRRAVHRQQVER